MYKRKFCKTFKEAQKVIKKKVNGNIYSSEFGSDSKQYYAIACANENTTYAEMCQEYPFVAEWYEKGEK